MPPPLVDNQSHEAVVPASSSSHGRHDAKGAGMPGGSSNVSASSTVHSQLPGEHVAVNRHNTTPSMTGSHQPGIINNHSQNGELHHTSAAGSSSSDSVQTRDTAGHREAAKDKVKAPKGRVIRARLWIAEGFPMSLSQLLPLLDVIGAAYKQLAKVAKFMHKYGDMDMFPVKVQVPLLFSVYALVSFKKLQVLGPGGNAPPPADFFEVPETYTRKRLIEVMDKHSHFAKHGRSTGLHRSTADADDKSDREGGTSAGVSVASSGERKDLFDLNDTEEVEFT